MPCFFSAVVTKGIIEGTVERTVVSVADGVTCGAFLCGAQAAGELMAIRTANAIVDALLFGMLP